MSSSEQSGSYQLLTPSEDLYIQLDDLQLPSLDNLLYDGPDLAQYHQDLNHMNSALAEVKTSPHGHDELRNYLSSSLQQIKSQSRLLTTTASSLRDSERSRSLLEKEVTHLLASVRVLSTRLRERTDTSSEAEVVTLLEERIASNSEVIKYKELAVELQLENRRLKTRHDAEKKADEEHIRLLFRDMAAKNQRIRELSEWQIWWQDAMRRRDIVKDEEITGLSLYLNID